MTGYQDQKQKNRNDRPDTYPCAVHTPMRETLEQALRLSKTVVNFARSGERRDSQPERHAAKQLKAGTELSAPPVHRLQSRRGDCR